MIPDNLAILRPGVPGSPFDEGGYGSPPRRLSQKTKIKPKII
jgi:hypothetical protein